MSVCYPRVCGGCGISQLRCSFSDSMGYLMDQLTNFTDILHPLATTVGAVAFILMSMAVIWCMVFFTFACWMWSFERVIRGLNIQKHFLCYVRDRLCGNVKIPLSVVIVTADKMQLCYLDGYKFYTDGQIAPWDEALRLAGCTVTHLMADPVWLEERGNIFPQCLKEVKFDADPDE